MAAVALVLINLVMLCAMHREIFRAFVSNQPSHEALSAGQEYADFVLLRMDDDAGAAMIKPWAS